MPSTECLIGELRGEVAGLKDRLEERDAQIDVRLDRIEAKIERLTQTDHRAEGAMWAFTKVGVVVSGLFTLIGWVVVHYGAPDWVRRLLSEIFMERS